LGQPNRACGDKNTSRDQLTAEPPVYGPSGVWAQWSTCWPTWPVSCLTV